MRGEPRGRVGPRDVAGEGERTAGGGVVRGAGEQHPDAGRGAVHVGGVPAEEEARHQSTRSWRTMTASRDGADADDRDAGAAHLLEREHVVLRRERAGPRSARAVEMSSFQPGKYSRIGLAWWKSDWFTGTSSNRSPSTSYATQTGIWSRPVRMSSLVSTRSVMPLIRVA